MHYLYLSYALLGTNMLKHQTGIVVPTLGTRPDYLVESLQSIRNAGDAFTLIVTPRKKDIASNLDPALYDQIVAEPPGGLAAAIHHGITSLPEEIEFVNWLGDDDLLAPGSVTRCLQELQNHPNDSLVYGMCEYIGPNNELLWTNRSGRYARWLMRCGPQLIPQPGSLFRRSSYNQVGGLNPIYRWAFDLDLLIKLSRVGRLHYTPHVLASFRWHDDSLSVGGRAGSVSEASTIRRQNLPSLLKALSVLWEWSIRRAILHAGKQVSRRSVKFTK